MTKLAKTPRAFSLPALSAFALAALALGCSGGPSGDSMGDGDGGNSTGEVICDPGETRDCYSGTPTTEGVGACTGGIETCNEAGTAFGNCEGEVTPVAEVCENSLDDDCNGEVDDIEDIDGDGFTICDGDCCETTDQCGEPALVNPASVEVIAKNGEQSTDENCNGLIDEEPTLCDSSLALDSASALDGASALDVCDIGLVSAAYIRADGTSFTANAQHGIQTAFGANVVPQLGSSMLALSSGPARTTSQPDACTSESCDFNPAGTAPAGFPQDVPGCEGGSDINDDIALELTLKAPPNAKGYSFDFRFYSFEYPEWVCTEFNDQFVALVEPAPEGAINGNIAFDSMTNPVSVNIAFFDVCDGCALGTADLAGTGYDVLNDAGATDWLRTQAPVAGGEDFTIKFMIWDTGDSEYDSTVLIDNFRWLADPVDVGTDIIVD